VGEIVAVCIRYYGGTKLGTGGLTRAYSGGVKLLLESLPTEEKVDWVTLRIIVDYNAIDGLGRVLEDTQGVVETQEFGGRVVTVVSVPRDQVDSISEAVAGLTRGQGVVSQV
jgi:putative IMPACT (imprinted ancient) family translation regulator